MKNTHSSPIAAWIAALAISGCSGATLSGATAPGAAPATSGGHALTSKSWLRPGSTSQKLLYVADSDSATVRVYSYPTRVYEGDLTGFVKPLFDCADKAGNVWIVDYNDGASGDGQMVEYAHGRTYPMQYLSGLSRPYECSVNRKNGDLAVAENPASGSALVGSVAVYHHETGAPTVYSDSNFGLIDGVTYDSHGNLFVDGYTPSDAFHYAELPAGSSTFSEITLSESPSAPGMVFWDGQYVDVGDDSGTIFQTQGSTVVNTISLNLHADTLRGFFVLPSRKRLIATDAYANTVGVFDYPAGGSAIKKISSGLNTPWCVVISP
jgi:hypothetical protein